MLVEQPTHFSCFQPKARHVSQTHRWRQGGIYSPAANGVSQWPGPWCLVGLKVMRTGNCWSRLPTTDPPRTERLERLQCAGTQGQQCAHSPCSHPLWKRCLSPFSCNISGRKKASDIREPTNYCYKVRRWMRIAISSYLALLLDWRTAKRTKSTTITVRLYLLRLR